MNPQCRGPRHDSVAPTGGVGRYLANSRLPRWIQCDGGGGRGRADRRPISRSLKKSCTRLQGSRRVANIPPAHILGAEYHHQPLRVTSPQQHQSMTIPDRRNHHSLTVSSHNHQPMRVRTARPGPNHERQGHGRCPAPDLERACDVGDAGGRRPRARVRLLGR